MNKKKSEKKLREAAKQRVLNTVIFALVALIAVLGIYIVYSEKEAQRAQSLNETYRELYQQAQGTFSAQQAVKTPEAQAEPLATIETVAVQSTASPAPKHDPDALTVEVNGQTIVLQTPDADTIRVSAPTMPPLNAAFYEILWENQEIVGWLRIADIVDLPVVQRDNSFYLNHGLDGKELKSGALFMDEANLLYPLDTNTLIYGHNMKDGSMFGRLSRYTEMSYLRENPLIEFSTLYETGKYVPFAVFNASMEEGNEDFFEIRRLSFMMKDSFDLFIAQLRAESEYYVPVDVRHGDALLSLVTCSYEQDDGRFIVVCRKLREGEEEEEIIDLVQQVRTRK